MQKIFYSDDLMEFKINNKWVKGNLKDIIIDQKIFILSLEKEEDKYDYHNQILLINNYDEQSIIKNSNQDYSPNQKIEFFDELSKSWIEGTIKTKNNDFYVVTYVTDAISNNSKILYKNNIRPLHEGKNILKLNINNVQCYSLKDLENLSNPTKYAKKFIKKLINLLSEKIFLIFLNNNFDLFIFSKENENENNNLVKKEVITGLINIAIKHFKDIDKENKKLFK
jgi:hypothetical protein